MPQETQLPAFNEGHGWWDTEGLFNLVGGDVVEALRVSGDSEHASEKLAVEPYHLLKDGQGYGPTLTAMQHYAQNKRGVDVAFA